MRRRQIDVHPHIINIAFDIITVLLKFYMSITRV